MGGMSHLPSFEKNLLRVNHDELLLRFICDSFIAESRLSLERVSSWLPICPTMWTGEPADCGLVVGESTVPSSNTMTSSLSSSPGSVGGYIVFFFAPISVTFPNLTLAPFTGEGTPDVMALISSFELHAISYNVFTWGGGEILIALRCPWSSGGRPVTGVITEIPSLNCAVWLAVFLATTSNWLGFLDFFLNSGFFLIANPNPRLSWLRYA